MTEVSGTSPYPSRNLFGCFLQGLVSKSALSCFFFIAELGAPQRRQHVQPTAPWPCRISSSACMYRYCTGATDTKKCMATHRLSREERQRLARLSDTTQSPASLASATAARYVQYHFTDVMMRDATHLEP